MSVEVHLDVLVKDTIATPDSLSVHTLSEIADLLGHVLHRVERLPRIRLIEGKEPFRRSLYVRHLFITYLLKIIKY